MRVGLALGALIGSLAFTASGAHADTSGEKRLSVERFRLIESESGPTNYYRVVKGSEPAFIRSEYKPGMETAVLGYELSDEDKRLTRKVRWQWRAQRLPAGGNECAEGKGDSAAVVYLTWKRGLRWYTLKYVWSAVGPRGAVCDRKRNPLLAQDTVILRTGGPLNEWRTEEIDLQAEFRKHFEDGDPKASVPDLLGIAIMSDGDQTSSESSADYASFGALR